MLPSSPPTKSYVLLTGATGMVGAQVLAKLLNRQVRVAVLARNLPSKSNRPSISAQDRIEQLLQQFESQWGHKLKRPVVMMGDINQPKLGLSDDEVQWLACHCNRVIHSAASLSFRPASESKDNEPFRSNVNGTECLVELCNMLGIDEFHHVSTAYVCGLRTGHVLEQQLDCGQSFSNDYERSKVQAESLVRNHFPAQRLTVYRPSIVIDSTGLSPLSQDRTIYGAFSMFQSMASRFGMPQRGEWVRMLGFVEHQCKNLVEANWVADTIVGIAEEPKLHGRTYHLTARSGTSIEQLDKAFHDVTAEMLGNQKAQNSQKAKYVSATVRDQAKSDSANTAMFHALAAPFVESFLPYFRDDPKFCRENIDSALRRLGLPEQSNIDATTLAEMIRLGKSPATDLKSQDRVSMIPDQDVDPIVIVGQAIRLGGGVNSVADFEQLLFEGRSAIERVPDERFDRSLYFDKKRGEVGKSYTEFGGCVSAEPLDGDVEKQIESFGTFDLTHRQFAQVAVKAWSTVCESMPTLAERCGVYVGHSGGTDQGGPLAMATLAETAVDHVRDLDSFGRVVPSVGEQVLGRVVEQIRQGRPIRHDDSTRFNAYSAAALTGRLLSLGGPREVIDAACASSLLGLSHAALALQGGRIDAAIVGGATYNNVDNLILFSQSQACSEAGSSPFDERAAGLISSEGYVAIVITRLSIATANDLPILGAIRGIGVASDGRGKSLWAPRTEGQQLAIRRGYDAHSPLDIDYLEAHATSTQIGDATEVGTLAEVLSQPRSGSKHTVNGVHRNGHDQRPLLIGSVKSNLGHTLEAAGLVGLVKLLIAMRRGEIPPTINFQKLNPEVESSSGKINVVAKTVPWPVSKHRGRRCAVNAFGIGGLNGHAVIESSTSSQTSSPTSSSLVATRTDSPNSKLLSDEPIAIVGRGLILPQAFNVAAFKQLLQAENTAIGSPPSERWRGRLGLGNHNSPYHAATNQGGYIKGYQFDGQPYRIPPKQVKLANPVQMMLIDAVAQAAQEADGGKWLGDRQRTSVVVGTIFASEFSSQLQVGLRLPEICRTLEAELRCGGVDKKLASQIAIEYRTLMLQRYTALLDETGSFTASTLASRIAKSFDLMGGACAVDADDASGSLALMLATDQLRAGTSDTVVCGVARRSLDLLAFKDLELQGKLTRSGQVADIPADCSQVLPGEGVAVFLLRRLSDAKRDRMPVLGLIDDFDFGTQRDTKQRRGPQLTFDRTDHQIVRRIGYLAGAHSLVRLMADTVSWESPGHTATSISSTAEDGFYVTAAVRPATAVKLRLHNVGSIPSEPTALAAGNSGSAGVVGKTNSNVMPEASAYGSGKQTLPSVQQDDPHSTKAMKLIDNDPYKIVRIEGVTEADFQQVLSTAVESPDKFFADALVADNGKTFSTDSRFVGGIVAKSALSVSTAAKALLKAWQSGRRAVVIDRELAILWDRGIGNNRISWAFPGQGAQYSAVPQVVNEDDSARQFLSRFDSILAEMRLPAVSDQLHDPQKQLGHDVWWTQLWVLAVSATLADSLTRDGHHADLVFGHSFGECGAAVQAGVMSLPQAIRFAKQRSDAVVMTTRNRGQLLSIRGTPSRVDAILATLGTNICITHHNAPEQTVVAGTAEEIAVARKAFTEASMASIVIPVPAAFHSPALETARQTLQRSFGNERMRPPTNGFFSTIQGRYVAEPDEIRNGLIDQLTQPLLYCGAIERIVHDGCGLIIDVGPSDMLNRLHRSIVGSQALCISLDGHEHTHLERLALIGLASECVAGQAKVTTNARSATHPITNHIARTDRSLQLEYSLQKPSPKVTFDAMPEVIDVTRRGKSKPLADLPDSIQATASSVAAQTIVDLAISPLGTVANNSNLVERFLIDLVVELTGYSPEVIDFYADLEAELGVDSIKKVQIIGELAEWASLELDLTKLKLSQFQSLGDIRDLANKASIPSDLVTHQTNDFKEHGLQNGQLASHAMNGHASHSEPRVSRSVSVGQIDNLMVDFVVDQTGYSPDVIDMDADLEGELGLDSIKKAQLIGELISHYDIAEIDLRGIRLAEFPTLGSIRDFVIKHVSGSGEAEPNQDALLELPSSQLSQSNVAVETDVKKKMTRHAQLSLVEIPTSAVRGQFRSPAPPAIPIPAIGTCRFGLTMVETPRRPGMPSEPTWNGPALIIGQNSLAAAIAERLSRRGIVTYQLDSTLRPDKLDAALESIWAKSKTPHLFITTPHDRAALGSLSTTSWQQRRDSALMAPFRVCQLWLQQMIDHGLMDKASLVSVLNMGGDFGFSATQVNSCESGGLAGLTKAMLIESWMRGYRETPMRVIDVAASTSISSAVEGIFRELAVPSHDEEVTVDGADRWAVRPVYKPLHRDNHSAQKSCITRQGTWIVTGGGRGITALTSLALAEKYDLSLHLLGTAPEPSIDEATRLRAAVNRPELRREVMNLAQQSKQNPIETWRDLEKAIEIDLTLTECRQRGIRASYHSVDVADSDSVNRLLERIRNEDGPIRGVIHGAGAGQDARFDRKRLEKVEKCIRAKVDGGIVMAEATRHDPLEWFVGFGSISGRFGANGHTDYSLANDMLAKVIDRLRQERPDVRCVTFHWHAWGDIGMATKPEAKLALEMIGMEFMPAEEGLTHFLDELDRGGELAEVLITDRNYVRKFFPGFGHDSTSSITLPLLDPCGSKAGQNPGEPWVVTLDPATDRFLSDHRIGGMPTLPFVVALELMAEAVKHQSGGDSVTVCRNVEALHPIKFSSDDAMAIELVPDTDVTSKNIWRLQADLRRRDGRIVKPGLVRFTASFETGNRSTMPPRLSPLINREEWTFIPIEYMGTDGPIYHGEALQALRSIAINQQESLGSILTPSPVQLGGSHRPVHGWIVPCAVMDAMLYASAVLAYQTCGRSSLPIRFDAIHFGRFPDPGEPLCVHSRIVDQDDLGLTLAADLIGLNGDHLLAVRGYRVHWLQ